MGFLGKASEFFAAPGRYVGNVIGDALHQASNYVCQLHYNTPGVIFDVSPFNRGLWQSLCSNRPAGLPRYVSSAYAGGQCDAVAYQFNIESYSDAYSGGVFQHRIAIFGPVRNLFVIPNTGTIKIYELYADCRGPGNATDTLRSQGTYLVHQFSSNAFPTWRGWKINSVVRIDGKPDTCGNPPPAVPAPVVLPEAQRSTVINVKNVSGDFISLPLVAIFPSASIDFDLSVPLQVKINNQNFYLTLEGWYSGTPGNSVDIDLAPIQNNLLNIEGALNQYFAPINPSIDNTLVLISPSGNAKGDEQNDLAAPKWLIVDLTKLPDKAQYGVGSPTIYFAGWLEFLKEGRAMPRQQINFEKCIFRFPDGADGYAYTFTNGAEGKVSVYVEREA